MLKPSAELLFVPNQEDGEAQFSGSQDRSFNVDRWASVTAHRVNGYAGPHACLPIRSARGLGLLPFHNFPAAIMPTGRTSAMGKLSLVTVGTFNDRGDGEGVVGAPFSCPGIAMSAFRKRHRQSS